MANNLAAFVSLCNEIGAMGSAEFAKVVTSCNDFLRAIGVNDIPLLKAVAIYLRGMAMLGMSR